MLSPALVAMWNKCFLLPLELWGINASSRLCCYGEQMLPPALIAMGNKCFLLPLLLWKIHKHRSKITTWVLRLHCLKNEFADLWLNFMLLRLKMLLHNKNVLNKMTVKRLQTISLRLNSVSRLHIIAHVTRNMCHSKLL